MPNDEIWDLTPVSYVLTLEPQEFEIEDPVILRKSEFDCFNPEAQKLITNEIQNLKYSARTDFK